MDNIINVLALNKEQHEWMLNLKALKVRADADAEKNEKKRAAKLHWLNKWLDIERSEFSKTFSDDYNSNGNAVGLMGHSSELIQSSDSKTWYYLAVLEAELFEPYYPLYCEDEQEDKELKGLKLTQKNYVETFVTMDGQIASTFIDRIHKTYRAAIARMDGRYSKIAIGALSAVAIAAITAATAGMFAGPIAVALVGGQFTFGGAALTSASLALLGGGSIAAGGAGMAGGVATIVGGGALLGVAVGGTASAAVTGLMLATPQMTLKMAAKLEVTIREVLLNVQHDTVAAQEVLAKYKEELKRLKHLAIDLEDENKETKEQIKALKKSIEYITRSVDSLDKFTSAYEIGQETEET